MKTAPNQKIVTIFQVPRNKTNMYGMFNKAALRKARKELGGSAFKIWTYINENSNGYTFALSQVDVQEETDVKKTAYHNAIKELIDLGYLVETLASNKMKFYENGGSSEKELSNENKSSEKELESDLRTNVSSENEQEEDLRTPEVIFANSENRNENLPLLESEPVSSEKEQDSSEKGQLSSESNREIINYTNKKDNTIYTDKTNEEDVPSFFDLDLKWMNEQPKQDFLQTAKEFIEYKCYTISGLSDKVQELRDDGYDFLWIKLAICHKTDEEWKKHGFRLINTSSFLSEINAEYEKAKPIKPQLTQFEEFLNFPTFGGNSAVIDTRPVPRVDTGLQELAELFGED